MAANNHPNQRPINKATVRILAERIHRGHWDPTAGQIVVDSTGRVVDGQHRLAAIVKSGKPVKCAIIRGEWSRWRDDVRRRSCAERNKVSTVLAAASRLAGRICNVADPDVALEIFSDSFEDSGLMALPHVQLWASAPVLVGGLAAHIDGSDPIPCIRRLIDALPQTERERRIIKKACSGKFVVYSSFGLSVSAEIFSAIVDKNKTLDHLRDLLDTFARAKMKEPNK